jgi:urease accessory protein
MGAAGLALLTLADGRFPVGGHAHSGGMEAAVVDGRVADEADLEAFVRGRLATTGLVDAALAAATASRLAHPLPAAAALAALAELDGEAGARLAPPAARAASRRLGRQLLRVAGRCWPSPLLDQAVEVAPEGLHQAVALGVTGVAAGLGPGDVARLAVHHAITTPAQAAVRLLGLDPFAVAALPARLVTEAGRVVDRALAAAAGPLDELPARAGALLDIAAVEHERRDDRLFAT